LAEENLLADDLVNQLISVGHVDLLVAVPSYNNASTIAQTVQVIEESYRQNFVRDRVAILNVDGGSNDHTPDVVRNINGRRGTAHRGIVSLRTVHCIATQYAKVPSQAAALRTILTAADLTGARACAIVAATTTNLDANWIANLLRPAYRQEFQFVAPLYARGKHQGLLARTLLYPMSRAVFGFRIREMYSDEWAFSNRLIPECLSKGVWNDDSLRARPEAWMAITAMASGSKCCQSFLGPKVLPSGPTPDLIEAIRQTVGNLFWCLEEFEEFWLGRTGSQSVPTFGPEHELTADDLPSNPERILEYFTSGVPTLEPLLASILTAETHARIKEIAALDAARFRFSPALWVRTMYEFAASYHRRSVTPRDHMIQVLVSLYRGFMYSFLTEHSNSSPEQVEADTEALCLEFENQKPYLVERWKAKS
jgi:glucosylglycerate synthase